MDKENKSLEERIESLEKAMANIQLLGVTSEVNATRFNAFVIALNKRVQKFGSSRIR